MTLLEERTLTIRPYQECDRERFNKLYTSAFSSYDGPKFPERLAALQFALSPETTLVAIVDQLLVGGATLSPLTEGSESFNNVATTLSWARERRDVDDQLIDYCKEIQNEFGGEVVMTFFDNEFTQGTFEPTKNDVYLSGLFVDEEYRGRGIGTDLVNEQIKLARERNASAIYVTCVESSPVTKIFKNLAFLPLLRLGPSYANGSAALEMGMRLR